MAAACAAASCSLLGHCLGGAQAPYQLERASSARSLSPPTSRSRSTVTTNGAGISTCCPSPTRCRLGLGPTHPLRSDLAAEPLDMRRWGFAPHESLLIPTFALASAPPGLPVRLLCAATLPYHTGGRWSVISDQERRRRLGRLLSPTDHWPLTTDHWYPALRWPV